MAALFSSIPPSLRVALLSRLPPFRGKRRLARLIGPWRGRVKANVYGFPFKLDLSDYIQRNIAWGQYEPAETHLVKSLLRRGDTFVDAGANIGYYTALAASIVAPTGSVIAFEPDPYCFELLTGSFAGKPGIRCVNAAVSDSPGDLILYMPPASHGNRDSSCVAYCEGMTSFPAVSTTLDLALSHSGRVRLLKMDIEGHELPALLGGENSLVNGRIEMVLCELNERLLRLGGSSQAEVVKTLESYGFALVTRLGDGQFANALFRHHSCAR